MKTTIDELALFKGVPAFTEILHVGRPNIGARARLLERVNDILDRNWLSNNGPLVQEFEQQIASLSGARHCIAMCNGTVALEIASRGLGMSGEVIVPAFTFVATVHALQWQEITPVFCDVDPLTHTLDPEQVRRSITPRTTGILGVHLWGNPCHLDALRQIAYEHSLKLLYDGSHAIACNFGGQGLGSFGDATVCSFHATKVLNTLEGGAVLTNDDVLAERLRLMKNFGFAGMDRVIYLGINGKMSEVNAAMGLTNLESLAEFVVVNRRHDQLYRELLAELPGVRIVPHAVLDQSNYQYMVLEIDRTQSGLSRDELLGVLHAENIRARRYFYPGCHRMEPYRSLYPQAGGRLPVTEDLADRVLCLPTGPALGDDDVRTVASVIRVSISNAACISRRLREHPIPWLKDRP
jgi:dTDP-4-amino-4,6-dideoxygalactose transaminase